MATILLSAAGAAVGSGFGGTLLGLSGAVIGRAVGATVGRAIDAKLLGRGSVPTETGRTDRFRIMGAGEGQPVPRLWGRVRVGGHVIWASNFQESVTRVSGGKAQSRPPTDAFSYSVSLAVALCEGPILRVGRIWADGEEIATNSLDLRVYPGCESQLPDPKIEATEGIGRAPAYRGVAYVVLEDLDLGRFGNRVPQFTFEVIRASQSPEKTLADVVTGVALIPGTGEYALATTPVHLRYGPAEGRVTNLNSVSGLTDFAASAEQLREELPNCQAVSVVVSWFGDDLRCGAAKIRPKVEDTRFDGVEQPWRAGGIGRDQAQKVIEQDGRVVYGGTPSDGSVIEAMQALRSAGKSVMFYPFILMEQLSGNGLPDPWSDAEDQPRLPWRGRITLSKAPGRLGSPDRSAAAEAELANFLGSATVADFSLDGTGVHYSGPADDWGYRRFILHYAHLCAAAGGVDAFCIGSELRGLTQIRGAEDRFIFVQALCDLLVEVRAILGADCKISYAADWSEYWGYQSPEGDRYFHLDPLWAHPEADFIGIDNYMPLSDWRDGRSHRDADWGQIYALEYLKANVAGGEGYDWYYPSGEEADAQIRHPITDGAHNEPWVWRYKDLRGWWENPHHERIGGARQAGATDWVPGSKPFWFTELGCAAINKGTNQPNVFLDPKSSESYLPKYSNGRRDDYLQMQYLRAMAEYWGDTVHNPVAAAYAGKMVDLSRAFVWAWDARPFPQFPGNADLWADSDNYGRGHWLSGRASNQSLSSVVTEICHRAGVTDIDVSGLCGVVRGYTPQDTTARGMLEPLMLAYGFEAIEREGRLRFRMRDGVVVTRLGPEDLAVHPEAGGDLELARSAQAEVAGRVRVGFVEAEADFEQRCEDAVFPDAENRLVSEVSVPLVLTRAEGRSTAERWLAEARIARDVARFALPPSRLGLGAGDVVDLGASGHYRIDRHESAGLSLLEAVRVEDAVYQPSDIAEERAIPAGYRAAIPVYPVFLDLPMLSAQQDPIAPHLAIAAQPWPGAVGVWHSDQDAGHQMSRMILAPSKIGITQNTLRRAKAGVWDRGPALRVKMLQGQLASAAPEQVLNSANCLAIGTGAPDGWEIFQFANAELVGPQEWALSLRLRGQLGTEAVMPDRWPEGAVVVVLDKSLVQLPQSAAQRGLARHYRIGQAARGYDDPMVVHRVEAYSGVALRPLSPVHLRIRPHSDGLRLTWVRRTRLEGDSWMDTEVPLGETFERYQIRVLRGEVIVRDTVVERPEWIYPTAQRHADAAGGDLRIEVAQLSERFGPGHWQGVDLPI